METLPDKRAPGLPDIPYSAYCRVCWESFYILWIEKTDHRGVCPLGHLSAVACPSARSKNNLRAGIADLKRQGLIKDA